MLCDGRDPRSTPGAPVATGVGQAIR